MSRSLQFGRCPSRCELFLHGVPNALRYHLLRRLGVNDDAAVSFGSRQRQIGLAQLAVKIDIFCFEAISLAAAAAACRAERQGSGPAGLTLDLLRRAFAEQVRSTVEQLQPHNVSNYLTLPDGVRVASLRRLEQSAILPFELEKAS